MTPCTFMLVPGIISLHLLEPVVQSTNSWTMCHVTRTR